MLPPHGLTPSPSCTYRMNGVRSTCCAARIAWVLVLVLVAPTAHYMYPSCFGDIVLSLPSLQMTRDFLNAHILLFRLFIATQ